MNKQERADRLYALLPAIYRMNDAKNGWQLQALLRVIAEQVNVVEDDISQLYENWFIETCQDWVVPYIGDLVGYQPVHDAGEPGDDTTAESRVRNTILIPRREVGNTIHYRRRRGTLSLLEQLARDVAGWPYAHAVEFYKYLGVTQNSNFLRSERGRRIDLRDGPALRAIGSPFAGEAHTVDVRRSISLQGPGEQGRYNIPSVVLFLWRLKPYTVVKTRTGKVPETHYRHTFSVLGNDTQLFTHPVPRQNEDGQLRAVDELNFPNPIGLQAFEKRLDDYYGEGKSLAIWTLTLPHEEDEREEHHRHHEHREHEHGEHEEREEREERGHSGHSGHSGRHEREEHHQHEQHEYHKHGEHRAYSAVEVEERTPQPMEVGASAAKQPPTLELVDSKRIVATDLRDWRYRPQGNQVAVDTRLGRIAFPHDHAPDRVYVSYSYAFSANIGGGMYHRPMLQAVSSQVFQVSKDAPSLSEPVEVLNVEQRPVFPTLRAALEAWQQWKKENAMQEQPAPLHGVIELADNGRYRTPLTIQLEPGEHLHIRAANGARPVLFLINEEEERKNDDEAGDEYEEEEEEEEPTIRGERSSRFTLDGLLIAGSPLHFEDTIDTVTIRHCTFVPGRDIDSDCTPRHTGEPDVYFEQCGVRVNIEHSIIGPCRIAQDDETPLLLTVSDSILDATNAQENALYAADDETIAYALLTIRRSTVIGTVPIHAIETAENSIFLGTITVARRQQGCMRFCSIVPGSRTPRRYNCQPDLVEQAVEMSLKGYPKGEREAAKQRERNRVQPRLNSVRYGDATYCQLALSCAVEIRHGADDESEMGVFHDLFQPQREANLRARLDDFTPAGMEAGMFYIN